MDYMLHENEIEEFLHDNNIQFERTGISKSKKYTLASIRNKITGGLYYLQNEWINELDSIADSVIIIDQKIQPVNNNIHYLVNNPQLVFYKLCSQFQETYNEGIHPTAIIDDASNIDEGVLIGPYCIIKKCNISRGVQLLSHVIVGDNVEIGINTVVEPHSYFGARGLAWIWDENGSRVIQPQLGGVKIGADCIIGSDITIVRGSLTENSVIGDGTLIAHGTKIGHGSIIEDTCHLANNVSLAGNVSVGRMSFLGSGCTLAPQVSIAERTIVGAGAVVTRSFNENNIVLAGVPASVIKKYSGSYKARGVPIMNTMDEK